MRHVPVLAVTVILMFASANARGDYLYDWVGDPAGTLQTLSDPSGDNTGPPVTGVGDILQIMYARDAANHYFRMDLLARPDVDNGAGTYSMQIDDAAGGGNNANTNYIAGGLADIDQIVMSHFSAGGGVYTSHHRHDVLAPAPGVDTTDLALIGGAWDHTEPGSLGTTLQWSIPLSELNPGPFTIYGSIHTIESNTTNDITGAINASAVPEPSTLALLGMGAVGLLMCYRRRR